MSKRRNVDNAVAGSSKQPRRARSEPLRETREPEKRQALRRLFGRNSSSGNIREPTPRVVTPTPEAQAEEEYVELGENDDPLLDDVPEHMLPEQLGFLVCAQEALRFLHGSGFSVGNPLFMRLRSRLVNGMNQLVAA